MISSRDAKKFLFIEGVEAYVHRIDSRLFKIINEFIYPCSIRCKSEVNGQFTKQLNNCSCIRFSLKALRR